MSDLCFNCRHALENNSHGPDQNDMFMEGDELFYTGRCTYCRICRAIIKRIKIPETPVELNESLAILLTKTPEETLYKLAFLSDEGEWFNFNNINESMILPEERPLLRVIIEELKKAGEII